MSAGDVGAELGVQAGANSDLRGEMRENVYWYLRTFTLMNCDNFILKFLYNGIFLV